MTVTFLARSPLIAMFGVGAWTAVGLLPVRAVLGNPIGFPSLALVFSLAAAFGLGASSMLTYAALLAAPRSLSVLPFFDLAAVLVSGWMLRRGARSGARQIPGLARFRGNQWLSSAVLVGVAGIFFAYAAGRALSLPLGEWDAWAIWNLKARFFFRSPSSWRRAFDVAGFHHPDYPPLVPLSVAGGWLREGREGTGVPIFFSLLFGILTGFVSVLPVYIARGPRTALLATFAMCGVFANQSDGFVDQVSSQMADVPAALFVSTTVLLLEIAANAAVERHRILGLAILSAGLAAWTKNEGIAFFVLTNLVLLFPLRCDRDAWRREVRFVLPASAVVSLLLLQYKLGVAPSNDLVSVARVPEMFSLMLNGARGWAIAAFASRLLWTFAGGRFLIVGLYWVLCPRSKDSVAGGRGGLVLLLMAVTDLAAVWISINDLAWHVQTLPRVLLQLWPATVFLVFFRRPLPAWGQASEHGSFVAWGPSP